MDNTHQLCTFQLDRYRFGIDTCDVQEVLRLQPMTPIPLAPPVVRGLMNLRGQIVMAIDLRRRFDLPALDPELAPTNVIVRTNNRLISFLVDTVCDVVNIPETEMAAPPDTLSDRERELLTGCYQRDDHLLLILNTHLVADVGPIVEASLLANGSVL